MKTVSVRDLVLLPQPRRIRPGPGRFHLPLGGAIEIRGDPALLFPVARQLQHAVLEHRHAHWVVRAQPARSRASATATLALNRAMPSCPAQGYRLTIGPEMIRLEAPDAAGIFYGVMTLKQMLRQSADALPACQVEDYPDFPSRGVMLDISRDKVPTLPTLFELVDRLAEWKLNHLELYTEHTFAYRKHREVWAQANPMTGEDILRLDAYCRARFVELVPNQNSFGHMTRWLNLPRYRHLAEAPSGFDAPWGHIDGPFSISPAEPGSLKLLEELFAELLPHFTSRKFNVGCDETFDLGYGKSKALCERKGKGRVYLEFLKAIHKLVRRHGRTMHFWGDIIIQHPELVPELPRDIVVLEWGYEADHPFGAHGAKFAGTGIPFYVCPGTSTWTTISGRTANCLGNLRSAAQNGVKYGARGFLITDWGDAGHWQYLPVSYLGFAAGAALSWCHRASADKDFKAELDRHAFRDAAGVMGTLAYDLGNAYRRPGCVVSNSSILFPMLNSPPSWKLPAAVTANRIRQTREYIEAVLTPLNQARMERPDGALIRDEFDNAARMLRHACDRALALWRGGPATARVRRALAADLRVILGEHRRLWMARNREGGLQDSVRSLEQRLAEYRA
jgi:hexosaminidase